MQLSFTKMHSLGNDFVVIDAVRQSIALDATMAKTIADRKIGIGCDQILIAEPSTDGLSDFRFRIYNADGSEVGQCGNGARCFLKFVQDVGLTDKREISVQTTTTAMQLVANPDHSVTVTMPEPRFEPADVPFEVSERASRYALALNDESIEIGAVSMGNPHAVQVVGELSDELVLGQGPLIEKHARFPEHCNAGFMQVLDRGHVRLRVYERGVGETLACGSGACGAVAVGRDMGLLDAGVAVDLPGGRLQIEWPGAGHPLLMTGPASSVFQGELTL